MSKLRRPWTAEDDARLAHLLAQGLMVVEIARLMGRLPQVVHKHMDTRKRIGRVVQEGDFTIHIPREVLADRDRRMMLAPRDLTAAIAGDPPIGYSALERRHG